MGRRPVQHRLNRRGWMSQDLESPCRLRPQDFVFAEKSVEPDHALIAGEYPAGGHGTARDRHSAPSSGWHMSPPRPGRRPPNPREIEPVTNGEREAEVPVAKLGRGHQAAAGGERPGLPIGRRSRRPPTSRGRRPHGRPTISTSPSWRLMMTRRASDWHPSRASFTRNTIPRQSDLRRRMHVQ